MKHFGTVATVIVFTFFATMNTLIVLRERRLASLGQYQAGVTRYLGSQFFRERWMTVHRKGKYVGYTGFTLEKTFDGDAIAVSQHLDSRVALAPFGDVRLNGTLVTDQELKPRDLELKVHLGELVSVRIRGRRQGEHFQLEVREGAGWSPMAQLPLAELHLGDALAPSLPIAGVKVGDKLAVPCFDPLERRSVLADVVVTAREVREVDNHNVDAYRLETTFRGVRSRSWVNEAGDVLVQELGPPLADYVLKRSSKATIDALEKKR